MDAPNFAAFNYMQQQQPQQTFQPAVPQPNMLQPGVGVNAVQPGLNPMSGYINQGIDPQAFQPAAVPMSGYGNAGFSNQVGQDVMLQNAMGQQAAMAQGGFSDMSMASSFSAMQDQMAAYQHPDMAQAALMGVNQGYGAHALVTPPWRTADQADGVDEADNTTTDALQLKGTSVFVAGLPRGSKKQSTLDEPTIRRFFSSRCGRVKRLRLQVSRGYCFVVFEKPEGAAAAVGLSGTDVILDTTSPDVTTRLVVKYAQDGGANEPVYRRSAALRASVYTESAAKNVKEILKSSEDMDEFYQAVCNVFSWLETGECSKRNCDQFLHMLQLMSGRASAFKEFDEERTQTRELEDLEWHGSMAHQCEGLRRTFEVANKQKVRDILSKPQRKNLDSWTNTVVEAAERFRKLFAAEANMEDDGGDDGAVVPPPPPPAPPAAGGSKRTADAVALAEAEAKIQEQEEALRTSRSRINFLEQDLKAKANANSAEHRIKSYEDEISSLKIQLKTSSGSATQKINNLEAKLAAMQKKLTNFQESQKTWQAKEKQWQKKEKALQAKLQAYKDKELKEKAAAGGDAGEAGGKTEGETGEETNVESVADVEEEVGVDDEVGDEDAQLGVKENGKVKEEMGMDVDGEHGTIDLTDDAQMTEASTRLSQLHACVAVCLAVYLTSHPEGTSISDLAAYLTKLGGAAKTISLDKATKTVQDAVKLTPGVFQRSQTGGTDGICSLVAYQTLQKLLSK